MKVKVLSHTERPDEVIAKAARQCYSSYPAYDVELTPTKQETLIKKIIRNGHHSCLEHASITFAISDISRTCSHQLVRHRMASYSQQSQRYTTAVDDCVIPGSIAFQPKLYKLFLETVYKAFETYQTFIQAGVPKEDARYILPNAAVTNIVVTMNFRELLHFFKLRLSRYAQWEIRELANQMLELCMEISPTVFEEVNYDTDETTAS